MMDALDTQINDKLKHHKLRSTDMRRKVLALFLKERGRALSNKDLEQHLDDFDRITLYRTIKSFEEKGIIHQAKDGSGVSKYAMCDSHCSTHHHRDDHAHFHCTSCDKTLCLEHPVDQNLNVPDGFKTEMTYIMVEGTCADCTS